MLKKLTTWVWNPHTLFRAGGALFVATFFTIPFSVSVGIDSIKLGLAHNFPGKEVGYLSAVNWWPNFGVVLPWLVVCLGWLLFVINRTNEQIIEKRMIYDKELKGYTDDFGSLHSSWVEASQRGMALWIVFAVIAITYSWWECWDNSIQPILTETITGKEQDWAVGALLKPEHVQPWANIAFSCFVFTIQGVGASLALLLIPICVSYSFFIMSLSYGKELTAANEQGTKLNLLILPNCGSSDKRRGFELFEDIGSLILGCALITYVALYLIILRNEYLRIPARTIWEMPWGPFAFFVSIDNVSNVIALMLGMILIICVVVLVPCVVLSVAARRARNNYLDIHEVQDSECTSSMVWWPFRWLKLNAILSGISLCVISLFAPSVAPYLMTVFAVALVSFVVWKIRQLFPKTEQDS